MFEAPSEQVWNAARAALEDAGYAIVAANQATGVVLAEREYPAREIQAIVGEPVAHREAEWWSVRVTLTVDLASVSHEHTRVTIRSKVLGRTSPTIIAEHRSRPAMVPLTSNGALEQQQLNAIAVRLVTPLAREETWQQPRQE